MTDIQMETETLRVFTYLGPCSEPGVRCVGVVLRSLELWDTPVLNESCDRTTAEALLLLLFLLLLPLDA